MNPPLRISAVVLSFNRRDALLRTLSHLHTPKIVEEIIVVDNGSSDGSRDAVTRAFPQVRVEPLAGNVGIEGFNLGAKMAQGELLLILDDDAWVDADTLSQAAKLLESNPQIGAIPFSPVHPVSKKLEWPHATSSRRDFPMMGCANLVRRELWEQVGGYRSEYFLYRNDTDLALTLLNAGYCVYFDPQWHAWHDSPVVARKSDRWLRLSTRNWIWMARRHGRGFWKLAGIVLGVTKALMHAGLSVARISQVIRGCRDGIGNPTRPITPSQASSGQAWRSLILLQLRRR